MSYLFILLCILVLELACTSFRTGTNGGKCYVSVHVENVPDTTYAKAAWLHQSGELSAIKEIDSIPVIHGMFSFECTIERLTSASICINENYMRIYLEPGKIEVNLDGSAPYRVSQSGTSVDKELAVVNDYLLENSKRSYNDCFNQFSGYCYHTEHYDLLEHEKTIKQRQTLLLSFCRSHIDYKIVPDLLHQVLLLDDYKFLQCHKVDSIFQTIFQESSNSDFYDLLAWEIKQVQLSVKLQTANDALAPDFQSVALDGTPFKLSNVLGRDTVLLHFTTGSELIESDWQLLAAYNSKPDLKLISIVRWHSVKDLNHFSASVNSRWPICISAFDASYYGIRVLDPFSLFPFKLLPAYVLISPKGIIIRSWEGNHGDGSSDHFSSE